MRVLHADYSALQGLGVEQIAELALLGLRYRALGAGTVDFSDPSRLDVYWTGSRQVEKAVKVAVRACKAHDPLAERRLGEAIGHLKALYECGVIDQTVYMAQWKLLLALLGLK
ncbi:hypothetical protein [Pseudomonas sp. MWU16-30317]|uniref:hypothetical protein n=1 Tax=Pseudomonas sp. MWU16-30317 TaxID=2878095 RepID=UPI001CFBFB7E|nr:hypothetical protein [Pseudomonas sp. MWU16-30317]